MTSLFLSLLCLNSLMDLYCLPNNMWTPPQISHEDPSLPQGFTSHLLLSDPAPPYSAMLSHPSVLPFASRQTQPLSSSSKATPLNSLADPAGPGGFLLPPATIPCGFSQLCLYFSTSHSSAFPHSPGPEDLHLQTMGNQ